jgi:hypothetical protein
LANSSQFDEINSDCVAVLNDESENSKETAKAGVSKTKAQDEIKAQIHATNGDLTWLYNRKSIGILTKKSRNRVEREKKDDLELDLKKKKDNQTRQQKIQSGKQKKIGRRMRKKILN